MNQLLNSWLTAINSIGGAFWDYSATIFVQSGVLIVLLLAVDFLLRKRVRATLRYWIWMLVFVKLLLPPTLSLPTGIGYWLADRWTVDPVVSEELSAGTPLQSAAFAAPEPLVEPAEIPIEQSGVNFERPIAAAPVRSPAPSITWQAVVFLLWLAGTVVLLDILLLRINFVRQLISRSSPADDGLLAMLDRWRHELGIVRNVELKLSSETPSPAACGLFKPKILMPADLPEKLSAEKLRAVLIHELAHIKRGDLWINSVQTVLQIVYFYNPLVWLAGVIVRRIREQAVDEMVLVTLGTQATTYSNTLIDVAEMAISKPSLILQPVGVVESKKALAGRIKHILSKPLPTTAKLGVTGLIVIALLGAILLPMAKGQPKKNNPFDENTLITFDSETDLLGTVKTDGDAKKYSKTYDVTFKKGEKLLVIAELYRAGKPMQVLGHKVFNAPVDIGKLSSNFSFSTNQSKTVTTHHGNLRLGEQVFDIPEFSVDFFPYTTGWGWFKGDALNASIDRRGRDYEAMEVLFYFHGSFADYDGKARFWIPASDMTPLEVPYAFALKAIPLSRLENLYVEPVGGWQGLDGKLMDPEGYKIEKVEAIVYEYRKMLQRIVMPCTATLASGVTVELVGVCEHSSENKQWWRPDGTIVKDRGFGDFHINNRYYIPESDEQTRLFAMNLEGMELKDMKLSWQLTQSLRSSFYPVYDEEDRKLLKPVQSLIAKFPREVQHIDLTLGIATGKWKNVARGGDGRSESGTNDCLTDRSVIFHEAVQRKDAVELIVTHLLGRDYDCRVIVIDTENRVHEPRKRSNSGSDIRSCKGTFDLSLDKIKITSLEARPFEWVEFKNISLRPGLKTNWLTENVKPDVLKVTSDEVLRMLEKERDKLEKRIETYRVQIHNLAEEHTSGKPLEQRQKMRLQRVADLLKRLTEQETKRIELESKLEFEMKAAYAKEIVKLETELVALLQVRAPKHPEVVEKTALLEAVKKRSRGHTAETEELSSLRSELEQTREFERRLKETIDKEDIETVRIGRIMAELQDLKDRLSRTEELYDAVLRRIEDKKVQQSSSARR
ncbi:MAG: M56 family metallopeptidase [Planctomycetota bacterium]|jgi:beta-lactamase regulating signal transducer with metallopeptidase domain